MVRERMGESERGERGVVGERGREREEGERGGKGGGGKREDGREGERQRESERVRGRQTTETGRKCKFGLTVDVRLLPSNVQKWTAGLLKESDDQVGKLKMQPRLIKTEQLKPRSLHNSNTLVLAQFAHTTQPLSPSLPLSLSLSWKQICFE